MRRIRVVAALIERGDSVLVQQRPEGKSLALLWEFPGGKVEAGEDDEVALARECEEELGVSVRVGEKLWSAQHRYPALEVELLLFRTEIVGGAEPHPHEAAQLAWVARDRLSELPFCEADIPLLALLADREF